MSTYVGRRDAPLPSCHRPLNENLRMQDRNPVMIRMSINAGLP